MHPRLPSQGGIVFPLSGRNCIWRCSGLAARHVDSFHGRLGGILLFGDQLHVTLIELEKVARGLINFLSTLVLGQETIEIAGIDTDRRINELVANIRG